jgi:tRNA nucleotidyltransferase/poly(A) polymerase
LVAVEDKTTLISQGFCKDRYIAQLYTQMDAQSKKHIDFYAVEYNSHEKWTRKDMITRDFTITSLLCGHDGKIIDRSTGVLDFKQKRLRMIGKPALRLREDPILLLRSAYYITQGFQPDESLDNALREWQYYGDFNKNHLFAVARKHLENTKSEEYVRILDSYGLLEKLFDLKLEPEESRVKALQTLLNESKAPQNHSFLSHLNHPCHILLMPHQHTCRR